MRQRPSANHPSIRHAAIMASTLLLAAAPTGLLAQEDDFNPASFDAELNVDHFNGATGHEITVQRIVSAIEDMNAGIVIVHGFTQVLDCKTPEVLSTTRCDPCEYPLSEWVKRPLDVWFLEKSWHRGSSVRRARALREVEHFNNYFNVSSMEGIEHRGMVHQFWRFDGRRPSPLEVRTPPPPEPPTGIDTDPPKEWESVGNIEIRYGESRPETVTTPIGDRSVQLTARAYARAEQGQRLTEDFWPFWSSDCGTFSNTSGQNAKETVFRLNSGVDTCNVYLYEARTGERRKVVVEAGREPPPPVRVAITFEGGREADGVVLSGSARWVDVEARAYNPTGEAILGFTPEWSVDNGRVEYKNDSRTVLRVHLNPGADSATVRARHRESGAEGTFEIKAAN